MKVLQTAALVWFITLSIAAAGVAQSGFPPQVSYQLEIIELLTSEERELVLRASNSAVWSLLPSLPCRCSRDPM